MSKMLTMNQWFDHQTKAYCGRNDIPEAEYRKFYSVKSPSKIGEYLHYLDHRINEGETLTVPVLKWLASNHECWLQFQYKHNRNTLLPLGWTVFGKRCASLKS